MSGLNISPLCTGEINTCLPMMPYPQLLILLTTYFNIIQNSWKRTYQLTVNIIENEFTFNFTRFWFTINLLPIFSGAGQTFNRSAAHFGCRCIHSQQSKFDWFRQKHIYLIVVGLTGNSCRTGLTGIRTPERRLSRYVLGIMQTPL
jgi:hypothetical protein